MVLNFRKNWEKNGMIDEISIRYQCSFVLFRRCGKRFPGDWRWWWSSLFITRIELFCGNIDEEEIFTITRFLKEFEEFSVDENIIERTIYVRKKYGLKIPDAIIVATAIEKDMVLITADKEIIKKVDDIEIIDPLKWS